MYGLENYPPNKNMFRMLLYHGRTFKMTLGCYSSLNRKHLCVFTTTLSGSSINMSLGAVGQTEHRVSRII